MALSSGIFSSSYALFFFPAFFSSRRRSFACIFFLEMAGGAPRFWRAIAGAEAVMERVEAPCRIAIGKAGIRQRRQSANMLSECRRAPA